MEFFCSFAILLPRKPARAYPGFSSPDGLPPRTLPFPEVSGNPAESVRRSGPPRRAIDSRRERFSRRNPEGLFEAGTCGPRPFSRIPRVVLAAMHGNSEDAYRPVGKLQAFSRR